MAHRDNPHDTNQNIRFGRAYSAHELIEQRYRELGFWSRVCTAGLIVLLAATIVTGGGAFALFALTVVAKVGVEVARAFYRAVYQVR